MNPESFLSNFRGSYQSWGRFFYYSLLTQVFLGLYLTQMSQKAQKVYIAKYVGGTKMNNFFEGLAECQRAF